VLHELERMIAVGVTSERTPFDCSSYGLLAETIGAAAIGLPGRIDQPARSAGFGLNTMSVILLSPPVRS